MRIFAKYISLLRFVSLARVVNLFSVTASFFLSKAFRKPIVWGGPFSISIEPTTSCNLRCPECPSGLRSFSRPTGMLSMPLFENILNQVHKKAFYLNLYFQGEPYLHPGFFEMVAMAKTQNLYTSTSTNAHYLNEENAKRTVSSGLDRLIISIDGTEQATYEQYRVGGQLDKVMEGARNLVKARKELKSNAPAIYFQFLVVRPNEHQVNDIKTLANDMGLDGVIIKTAQLSDYENGHPLMPENQIYSRYRRTPDGKYKLKNKLKNHCWRIWHSSVITWDGQVVPCCFDKDAGHSMGNMADMDLKTIWKNAAYQSFREAVLTARSSIDICINCTEGTKVFAG